MSSTLDELDKHLRNKSLSARSLRSVIDSLNTLRVVTAVQGEDQFDSFYRKAMQLCKKVIEHPVFDMAEFPSVVVMTWEIGKFADRKWIDDKDKFSPNILSAIASRAPELKELINKQGGMLNGLVAKDQTLGDFLKGVKQYEVIDTLLALELEAKTARLTETASDQHIHQQSIRRHL
jgi:hypothetical protein